MATSLSAVTQPVALVTGASRGIGRSVAQFLAQRGVRVAVHFQRNEVAAQETLLSLEGEGHAVFAADVADGAQCEDLIKRVLQHFGVLDVLVNNAGIYEDHDIKASSYPEWRRLWQRTMEANLSGPANLTYLAVQHMRPRGTGRIINVSSRGAFRGEPMAPAYGAAKAGLNSFGQSMARALAPDGITFFTVAPGWIATDMAQPSLTGPKAQEVLDQHPLGRVGTPDEIAEVVAWLALEAPANLTGCIIDANGASYLRT